MVLAAVAPTAGAQRAYSLADLIGHAEAHSPVFAVAGAELDAARAGVRTARAYPNPEVEALAGTGGAGPLLALSQPLENPWLRQARREAAEGRVSVVERQSEGGRSGLVDAIRRRYHERIRLQEELQAFREDLALAEQIRDRIRERVRAGESPRFDLYRAEGEVAVARKNIEAALPRLRQSDGELRGLVGPGLPDPLRVSAPAADPEFDEATYAAWRAQLRDTSPQIRLAAAELALAERQLEQERNAVLPQVAIRATHERDGGGSLARIGAVVSLPLANRREGPIAEARAQLDRRRYVLAQREHETAEAFDAAWHGYRSALAQTYELETRVIGQARTVLEIAEAAYRLGERGILDYLDAQRQFRLVRNETIQARFARRMARVELERLAGR